MTKKILALFLALVCAFSLILTGCTKPDSTGDSTISTTQPTTAPTQPTTEPTTEPTTAPTTPGGDNWETDEY